jgi:hypothetical protein
MSTTTTDLQITQHNPKCPLQQKDARDQLLDSVEAQKATLLQTCIDTPFKAWGSSISDPSLYCKVAC